MPLGRTLEIAMAMAVLAMGRAAVMSWVARTTRLAAVMAMVRKARRAMPITMLWHCDGDDDDGHNDYYYRRCCH